MPSLVTVSVFCLFNYKLLSLNQIFKVQSAIIIFIVDNYYLFFYINHFFKPLAARFTSKLVLNILFWFTCGILKV